MKNLILFATALLVCLRLLFYTILCDYETIYDHLNIRKLKLIVHFNRCFFILKYMLG